MTEEADEAVTLRETAKRLHVCARTVRREIERGRLIAFRVGRSVRIRTSELRRYMDQQALTVGL